MFQGNDGAARHSSGDVVLSSVILCTELLATTTATCSHPPAPLTCGVKLINKALQGAPERASFSQTGRTSLTGRTVWEGASGFDVSGAFAVRVGGAAPELAGGFAGGAAAHGFAADGAQGYASLFSAGLNAGGVEAFGEATVFFEIAALALNLTFEQIRGLIDGAEHGIASELGIGFGDELRQPRLVSYYN